MKAIMREEYGPPEVLQLKEVEKPTPKENEMLVKVHAASVNYIDYQMLRGKSLFLRLMTGGLLKPKHEILEMTLRGGLKRLAATSSSFSRVMRYSVYAMLAVLLSIDV